ncbi:MAG: hypothetical protein ACLQVA_13000 [Candidatus Brocadiia bacterium]
MTSSVQAEPKALELRREEALYGSVEMPLSLRQWMWVAAVVLAVLAGLPVIGRRLEAFQPGPDYRIPYEMSSDYWLFERYSRLAASESKTLVVGDSVVWGEYVAADETLSHYLAAPDGENGFANLGVDGMYPVAQRGLLDWYGGGISNSRVILHFNPLWMASPEHDLRAGKEFRFNHPELLPQFSREIPAYKASFADRLAIVAERLLPFRPWVRHWRWECLGGADLARWTLKHPYGSPFTVSVRRGEEDEPARRVNLSWKERGATVQDFPWVSLAESPQWRAFRDSVEMLRRRGDTVLVAVGPLNEYMLTPRSRDGYRRVVSEVGQWLRENGVLYFAPPALPSEYYADASHPLRAGYAMLGRELLASEPFARLLQPATEKLAQGRER